MEFCGMFTIKTFSKELYRHQSLKPPVSKAMAILARKMSLMWCLGVQKKKKKP